jgi:hypothetical protein
MRRMILVSTTFVAAAILSSSLAFAQTTAEATITPASSGHGRGIGVGALTMLNGTSGGLFTWGNPSGIFHVDGFFGLHRYNPNGNYTTSFSLGGRFWYHVSAAAFADLSLGGGIGITRWETNPGNTGNDDRLDVALEIGSQMRVFIVPNVALIADLGLGITFGQHDDIMIGGQSFTGSGSTGGGPNFVAGTLGIAYFFE